MVRIDRVRKSSGGIEGKFMLENERAAWRRARREAVKFDLNADFRGRTGTLISALLSLGSGEPWKTRKSNSSTSIRGVRGGAESGCSSRCPGGDETGSSERRVGVDFRRLEGAYGDSIDDSVSVVKESAREGMDSTDTVRVESADPMLLSDGETSSHSSSSGALNSTSKGLLSNVKLSSFSDSCDRSIMDSTVRRLLSLGLRCCRRLRDPFDGGGMLVIANRAATDGGMASGE